MTRGPSKKQLVLSVLVAYPDSTVKEIAQRLNLGTVRTANLLAHLEAYGVVQGELPPLMKRGKRYRLSETVAGLVDGVLP